MSQARVYTTAKVRKSWICGKCGADIVKGVDGRISFAVGFRGFERTRCLKSECYPTRSELESSAVATVYDAMDSIDWDSLETADDFTEAVGSVAEACQEVASEYEQNEMYEINELLQERVQTLESTQQELESWEPSEEAPEQEDGEDDDDFALRLEEWKTSTRDEAQEAVEGAELP